MIKLSNVSTERLMTFLKFAMSGDQELCEIYKAMLNNGVKDFEKLKELFENNIKGFNNDYIKSAITEVEANILYANENGKEPVLFPCDDYAGCNVDLRTLQTTDRKNSCGVLLYKSPAIVYKGKSRKLQDIQINDAKQLLGKVVAHDKSTVGNNAFVESLRSFDEINAEKVRDSINFYEKQVVRQASETTKTGVNVFILNEREKKQIVRDEIVNIVKYLIDNADVCVWGEFTKAQKQRLITAVKAYNGYENLMLKNRIIEVIANYTTLSELQSGVVKQKTLDRFIVK